MFQQFFFDILENGSENIYKAKINFACKQTKNCKIPSQKRCEILQIEVYNIPDKGEFVLKKL